MTKITKVAADRKGGFVVEYDNGSHEVVRLDVDSPAAAGLAAWIKAGNKPSPYEASMAERRADIARHIAASMESMGRALVAKYPETEQKGWPRKAAEAEAIVAGLLDAANAPQLSVEAGITGENVEALAAATVAAARLTGMLPAIIAGLRRKLAAELKEAASVAELDAIRSRADAACEAIKTAFASGDPAAVQAALAEVA
ncbi:MAG: hypothetical protein CR993_00950 [Rhodobacterales bacterium]|nr:MAG: hypothetical protein CR993_00950 [Rhodobacterales bacterium]